MKKLLLLPLVALGIASCGGGSAPPPAPTINLTGVWVVDLSPVDARLKLTLNQPLAGVNGDAEAAYYRGKFVDLYEPFGKVGGEVVGATFTLTITALGEYSGNIILSGTTVAGKMTGTWSGTGAKGETTSGSFVGTPQEK